MPERANGTPFYSDKLEPLKASLLTIPMLGKNKKNRGEFQEGKPISLANQVLLC